MKIKNFIAADIAQAMNRIRDELGPDAVIISSQTLPGGEIQLSAALDDDYDLRFDENDEAEIIETAPRFNDSLLREALEYHGTLEIVRDRILAKVRQISAERNLFESRRLLEYCFQDMFRYASPADTETPVKMFMGTPGSGKSTAIAKTATQAKINGISCCILSTDNVRAGANQQLKAFADILETDFLFCKGERSLYETVNKAKTKYPLVLIDTPGINPFLPEDVKKLTALSESVKCERILTLDAGKNTCEAVEIADIFSEIGAGYLMPTRLDLTRRFGAVLSVASCCELSFCYASVSSHIAKGLAPVNAASLAHLIFG